MNRVKARELLPIIQAFADGKDIQCHQMNDTWKVLDDPQFSIIAELRIKPEPIEIWCMVNNKGHCLGNQPAKNDIVGLIATLNRDHSNGYTDYKAVLFRQVMDE